MTPSSQQTDVAIIGAGILGLSHAFAFAKRGLRVTVFERSATPLGASVRNFGMVLVTGQPPGAMHTLARESRGIWLDWAEAAGLHVRTSGSLLFARSSAEADLLEAFYTTRAKAHGYDAALLNKDAVATLYDGRFAHHGAALHGREDLQLFSREAIPALVTYLREAHGVEFRFGTLARHIDGGRVETNHGEWRAEHVVLCAGHDYQTLLADELSALKPKVCALQMLRVKLAKPLALDHAVLTGLSCLHYGAFSDLPEAAAVHEAVQSETPLLLEHGIHLLSSPTPYGDLIIGDSHHYGQDASPFNSQQVDDLLLTLANRVFDDTLEVVERWQGVYGASNGTTGAPFSIVSGKQNGNRNGATGVFMHSGVGMSVGPAVANRVVAHLLDGNALPSSTGNLAV